MKNGERRRGPFSLDQKRGFRDALQPADARADQHAGAVAIFFGLRLPAGIRYRLLGGGQAEEDEIVDPALFLGIDPLVGIERAVGAIAARHIAGNLRRQIDPYGNA